MNKLSLFSGIGGDDIASEWAGIKTVCFVEKDKYCQKVLRYHWPDVPIIEDVRDVNSKVIQYAIRSGQPRKSRRRTGTFVKDGHVRDSTQNETTIDIIAGGFPCQPHSVAGKHKGADDERNLWPEFRRVIGEIKPGWVVAENVPGLFSTDSGRFFRGILRDLSEMGYSAGWCTFGAVDVGAWHRRDRVFIVGYSQCNGCPTGHEITGRAQRPSEKSGMFKFEGTSNVPDTTERIGQSGSARAGKRDAKGRGEDVCNSQGGRQQEQCEYEPREPARSEPECAGGWEPESRLGYLADGLSYWMAEPDGIPRVATGIKERVSKLKALGNAVVPYQIYPIYRAIVEIESTLDQ